jgi:putative flavoprotein involved in K+ transport
MQEETSQKASPDRLLDAVVVGGGQAGLAIAWHLKRQGLQFLVLEAGSELGHTWRDRWDSLKLFTPAQYDGLPGMPFPSPPDTYPTKDPVADYLQTYVTAFDLPVRLNTRVTSLTRAEEGFEVSTADDTFHARQVVVATGPFQVPFVRPAAQGLEPSVTPIHSASYRNPETLPGGPVLVVGGGNSGFQIAEELAATRQVDLSIGERAPMLPQRRQGPVLVAHPARPAASHRRLAARPASQSAGVHHRDQQAAAPQRLSNSLAAPARFERATPALGERCSIP